MELTKKEKYLMACFKAYEMEEDEAVGAGMLLKTEVQQDKMLEWIKNHTAVSPDEVLMAARKIAGLI